MPAFALGDQVEKIGGRYGGPGRVVSVSEDLGGGYPASPCRSRAIPANSCMTSRRRC